MQIDVPVWEKYILSIEEASAYFHIGENKLRDLINKNPDANYVLRNKSRIQIKKKLFEHFIDGINEI